MTSLSADEIIQKLQKANDRSADPASVWSQFGLMAAISAGTILAFNVLRPKNKIIYEPKVKYHIGNKPPPRISDGLFGWIPPLIHTKEPELVEKIGLDAVTFLRFLRLMRWLLTAVALLCGATLIPVNVIYNYKNKTETDHEILNVITIRDVDGNALYAHVAATYIITIIICVFVWFHWRAMARLRHNWFRSPEFTESFYSRTLAVRKVPRKYQTDAGIKAIFDGVKVPYPTTSVNVGRRVGKLPELIDFHNDTVRELEKVLVLYLKNGKIGKKRPTVRIGGFWGMGGQKYDAIDYYTAKLKRTEAAIDDYRSQIDTRKPEPYGFASMAAVPYAHIVAKMLQSKHPHGTTIELAPNPKDIIWNNMDMTELERTRKRIWGFTWLVVACFLNTVPLLIISFLANINNLAGTGLVPFLDQWKKDSENSFSAVAGILPSAVSAAFGYFLPLIIRALSRYMGDLTHSKLDRSVFSHYFAFIVVSQLIIFTLIGVFLNLITLIIAGVGRQSFAEVIRSLNLEKLPNQIKSTYIDQSFYWLTFFPLRGFLVVFDLAQVVNLVWLSFKTRVFGRTPRDIREWTEPPEFQYSVYYTNILFMACVALVFAPLAPAVVIAAAVVMWMSSWVYKYQLMFVFVSRVESGGRMWNMVINRLLFCVVLMQLIMVLTIGIAKRFRSLEWITTLPPILIVAIFKIYINRKFLPEFKYFVPTKEELQNAKIHSGHSDNSRSRLDKRFGHPALHAELFTPMLHAKMMPLLNQVYSGKIDTTKTKLEEYHGQKMDTHIVQGGIKIAAIEQSDLERPDLYGRDRGELDWDARSMASTTAFGDAPGMIPRSKSPFYASTTSLAGQTKGFDHDKYMAYGPNHHSNTSHTDIELARMDSMNEPLLSARGQQFYQQQQQQGSQPSIAPPYAGHAPQRSGTMGTDSSFYPPRSESPYHAAPYQQTQSPYQTPPQQYPARFNSPAPSFHSQAPSQGGHGGAGGGYAPSGGNMAGRGAHRT